MSPNDYGPTIEPLEEAERVLEQVQSDEVIDEGAPLLDSSTNGAGGLTSRTGWTARFSRPAASLFSDCGKDRAEGCSYTRSQRTRWIILALIPLLQFSSTLVLTTVIDIFRSVICIVWYKINDPEHVPIIDGTILDDGQCDGPGVNEWFSFLVLGGSVARAIGGEPLYFSSSHYTQ